jgi:uncharacterized membrane protein YdfJ with MMPL/SSD domain
MVAIVAALAGLVGWTAPDHLSERPGDLYSHDSESFSTTHEFETNHPMDSPGSPNLAVITRGSPESSGRRTQRRLEGLPQIAKVEEYVFPSRDRRSSNVVAWLRKGAPEAQAAAEVSRALGHRGIVVGGSALARYQFREQIKDDLRRAEMIAFPLLLLLGFWVFRSVVSALLPVLIGGFALLCGLACLRVVDGFFPLSFFSLNISLALVVGLGVDYSLLMVSRFREELAGGLSSRESARVTVRTAGRAVAFSSAAIAASFSSLLVFPIPFIRSIAVGGVVLAPVAGIGALLILPALFVLLGVRVNALAPSGLQRLIEASSRPRDEGAWYRLAHFVLRRPVAVALMSAILLIVLGLPSLAMRFTGFDVTSLPTSASTRVFSERIRKEFDNPVVGEIEIATHGNRKIASSVKRRLEKLSTSSGLATPLPVGFRLSPDLWHMNLNPTDPVLSAKAIGLVEQLRQMNAPITVAGETATYMDIAATLKRQLPYALLILAVSSFLFLLLATGSVVLPLKTLVMNVLSLGAAFGLLVSVFQEGRLQEVLDYRSQGALLIALPIVMGAGAFGLLTDYGLFLLLRIKEAREEGLSDREAIALGLERTGRIVTAAALLFSVAVGAFATSGLVLIKEAVIGITAAVLLDAFVVRPLLVPSLMAILGRWNWWPGRGERSAEVPSVISK